jgi:hypothetical protein
MKTVYQINVFDTGTWKAIKVALTPDEKASVKAAIAQHGYSHEVLQLLYAHEVN